MHKKRFSGWILVIDGRMEPLSQRWSWLKMANLLAIPDGADRYRLRLVQEFIAMTEPAKRSPGQRGIAVAPTSWAHFPDCSAGLMLGGNYQRHQ